MNKLILLIIALLCYGAFASSSTKGPTKFRQSLTTLTMGDLPDLEMEQPASLDDVDEPVNTLGAPVTLQTAAGVPSEAALSSFQQFLEATTPATQTSSPSSLNLAAFSGSGGFSGSGADEFVIGYSLWTKRVASSTSGKYKLAITVEATTATAGAFTLTPLLRDSTGNIDLGASPLSFNTASLPTTVADALGADVTASPETTYTLEITAADSTGASDVTTKALFKTGASWVFGLEAVVNGKSVTLTQTTMSGVDGFLYYVLPSSTSRPTIESLLTEGSGAVQTGITSTGEQEVTFDFATGVAYGDYVIYVVQVSTYAQDSINIAIGAEIAVTYASPCAVTPCQNGGVCTGTSATAYTCNCDATDYTGTTCGTKIDNCAASPCQNGGTCVDGVRSYNCSCAAGYTGTNCTTNIDDCASSPCKNGGTCVDGINSFTCSCPSTYTGFLCQVTSSTKCNAAPCLNGATCTNATASPYYVCTCATGYTGDICDTKTSTGGPTRPTASVRIVQTLTMILAVAEYPAFKANYAATILAALKMAADRFSWVYFGPKRTTSAHGFATLADEFEAQFDFLAPAAGDNSTTANMTSTELLASFSEQVTNPNSTFAQAAASLGVTVSAPQKSCSDGSTVNVGVDCPLTVTSSTGTDEEDGDEQEGKNSKSTWIALGCAVGAFFAILAGFLCYCQRKKPQRVVQTGGNGEHELLGGNNDLQDAWDQAHPPTTFVEMNRTDVVITPAQS